MAEDALTLRFRVFNANIAVSEEETFVDGEPATIKRRRLLVDAEPLDGTVKTLELSLPAALADRIQTGAILSLAVTIEAGEDEANG